MKTTTKFALLFLTILLSACSITPKYHSLGYHIEWKHNFKQNERSSATKKIIAENTRENYNIAQKSRGLTTPNHSDPKNKSLTANHLEITTPEIIDIARQTTAKPPQQTTYKSHQQVREFSQISDTPITYKQLRKLSPNPPMVVKINHQLRAIRSAIFAISAIVTLCFILLLDAIIFGNIFFNFGLIFLGLSLGPILLYILAFLEFKLFNRRQKILNELYVQNPKAIRLLKTLDNMFYVVLILSILGTPIYHYIWHNTFKKLKVLEPNNPYIELRKRKTRWNMMPGYLILFYYLVLFLLKLFI
jgi:hypothetical protein